MRTGAGWIALGGGILLLLTAGCGGGAGNSTTTFTLPASRLRTPEVGQAWTYTVTGMLIGDGLKLPLVGELTRRYDATSAPGATLTEVEEGEIMTAGQTFPDNLTTLIAVDNAGNVNDLALQERDDTGPDALATPIRALPGDFSFTTQFDQATQLTVRGGPYSHAFKVNGMERLTVPAGTFLTWRVTETVINGTNLSQQTVWYAPEIGNIVKSTIQQQDSANPDFTTTLLFVLKSTNVH